MLIDVFKLKPLVSYTKEEIQAMADSFLEVESYVSTRNGILHRPMVDAVNNVLQGNLRVLAAQYLATQHLERPTTISGNYLEIEVEVAGEGTLDIRAISLTENLMRHNLEWPRQVELERELHNLRITQHGQAKPGRGKRGWGLRDTAQELNLALGVLSEDLQLAAALQSDPTLRNIKDKTTALRIVKQRIALQQREEDSGAFSMSAWANSMHFGDALEVLPNIPAGAVDLVITDPPWQKFKIEELTADDNTHLVFKEVFRVMRTNSFLYLICGVTDFRFYSDYLPTIGFKVQEWPIIWHKVNCVMMGRTNWQYNRNLELILVAVKGAPVLSGAMLDAVYSIPVVPPTHQKHPNEKPLELIRKLIEHASVPDALILDPFAGSGVVGEAAKNLQRNYVLIERDKNFAAAIKERLTCTSPDSTQNLAQ